MNLTVRPQGAILQNQACCAIQQIPATLKKYSMISRFKYWLPAICVGLLISIFSSHYFSAEQTGHIVLPILKWLFPSASRHMLRVMHFGIRKAAHVIEFATFSIAVFHGVRGPRTGWQLKWALITLVVAVAFAGFDEWHQSFVPLREPTLRDVIIDGTGALLAQLLVWAYARFHHESKLPPEVLS
jgi:VanZ family protein